MRYIGCKTLMLKNIMDVMRSHTHDVRSVSDIFSGTGTVAKAFASNGYSVNSNDILYLSYVLNKGALEMQSSSEKELRDIIDHLNALSPQNTQWFDVENAFIYQNYSPNGNCGRMYFQCDNAMKIDLIRQEIERLRNQISEQHYFYLLSSLINAVPYVSNITGTYGAYLKFWDKRTYNPLKLEFTELLPDNLRCQCYNMEAMTFANEVESDLVYLDPPYNGRQYLSNYHILETIAKYDNPPIKGVTGMRDEPEKMSDFCKKRKARDAFIKLLDALQCRYILLSYNNESLLSTEEMTEVVSNAGKKDSFKLFEYDYRRYKNKIPNNKAGLKEQLYFVER